MHARKSNFLYNDKRGALLADCTGSLLTVYLPVLEPNRLPFQSLSMWF